MTQLDTSTLNGAPDRPLDDAETLDDLEADSAPRMGRKRDHTRDAEILAAALDVLAEEGYDGMTVDLVATRARAGKATLYRRWPSKAELVIDAVAYLKTTDVAGSLPDTGTLRGDLIALIKPHTIEDGERKMQIMAGIASMLSRSPELADTARAAMVEPRAAVNRQLFQRAVDRGEISADHDFELLSMLSPSLVTYRVLMLRQPVDRAFLISIIDEVLLPALGIPR